MKDFTRRLLVYFIVICFVVICLVVGEWVWNELMPQWQEAQRVEETKVIVEQIAHKCKRSGVVDPAVGQVDAWGYKLQMAKVAKEEAILYLVISPGSDGEFDTEDDIAGQAIDLNKSKLIGKWLGEKTKEVTKGVIDGMKEKSDFEPAVEVEFNEEAEASLIEKMKSKFKNR